MAAQPPYRYPVDTLARGKIISMTHSPELLSYTICPGTGEFVARFLLSELHRRSRGHRFAVQRGQEHNACETCTSGARGYMTS